MAGGVGTQYTPAAGWAQAVTYHRDVLQDESWRNAIAVVLGGDGAVATNGFWSALTMATTLKLPLLFYVEDNGYGLSVPSSFQTPGGNIAENLASFKDLLVLDGDGCDPAETARLSGQAVAHVRSGRGPCMLRLSVPRLSGHSGQDTQAYKPTEFIAEEENRDPLPALREYVLGESLSEEEWNDLARQAKDDTESALTAALARPEPQTSRLMQYVYAEQELAHNRSAQGGLPRSVVEQLASSDAPNSEPARINMLTAIRRTLESELRVNERVLVFGEDVGPKGGVHACTMGLQKTFGDKRVFDTSLSEEGIIGRAVGMAISGLMPVTEIQFRKYADPAAEQINDCGTVRWRTNNRFCAPLVMRIAGGHAKCGDPWHSQCGEVAWAHAIGWQVAFPSNAEDAVGLLRAAMRSHNPTIFFEHRALLDDASARRPYPGDQDVLPFGCGKVVQPGSDLTIVSWGAMIARCAAAIEQTGISVELIDLRSIMPWDRELVIKSVQKTRRCLIVHEDSSTAGFGAEIAATVASEAFLDLDAPVERLTVPDVPLPYNVELMETALPTPETISEAIYDLVEF